VAAMLVSYRQLHEAEVANSLPTVIDLFREYRSPALSKARSIVFQQLGPDEQQLPLSELPDSVRPAAYSVCHYLDNLGVLVTEGLVEPRIVTRFLGRSAIDLWERLHPCIKLERAKRNGNYQRYFEGLAATAKRLDPELMLNIVPRWE